MNNHLLERDTSSDFIRWLNKLDSLITRSNQDLEKLQNEIIKDNDSAMAYFFATEFSYQLHRMQKIILDTKNAKYAFLFAQNIPNCDVKALQKIVVDSK